MASTTGGAYSTASGATFFLKVVGEKSGNIKGNVIQKGREGLIQVYSWHWDIASPRDAASGLPTGKRKHAPIVFRAPIGKQSPILAQALCTNERLKEATLLCWTPSVIGSKAATGTEQQYYTVKLTNANVSALHLSGGEYDGLPFEDISMTYQKIEWTYVDGGITAMDEWMEPNF